MIKDLRRPEMRQERADNFAMTGILLGGLGPNDALIDVGAHNGSVLQMATRLAPNAPHVAVEPIPDYARQLRSRFPSATVHAVAASDRIGESDFHMVIGSPMLSGLRRRGYGTANPAVEVIRVDTAPLDALVRESDVRFAVLKIDVEGNELAVLRGARRILEEHRPLVLFEHGVGAADFYNTSPEDIHALLSELRYHIFDLDGGGPYDAPRFRSAFDANQRWNWLARP